MLHPDLRDRLSACCGGELAEARRTELLAQLRGDEAFRRVFVE